MRLLFAFCIMLSSADLLADEPNQGAPIVFFDIAGPDSNALQKFYADVFGWKIAASGSFTTKVESPLPATIRKDPADKRIYIGVEDVAAKLKEIKANGGTPEGGRFEVKGVVVLGLFSDPAGNHMGLVEMKDGKRKIP